MFRLNANIEIAEQTDLKSEISSPKDDKKVNISSTIQDITNKSVEGKNPFILGFSKIGKGASLTNNVDYFIHPYLIVEEGDSGGTIIISISSGKNIENITIEFDKINDEYPTGILINDIDYYELNSPIFTYYNSNSNSIKILFYQQNANRSPLVITGIYVKTTININKQNLVSLNRQFIDRENIMHPSYGIYSNSGKIEFRDNNGEVKEFITKKQKSPNLSGKIYLEDSIKKDSYPIGDFITNDWDYDDDNRIVTVSIYDDLQEWQNITVDTINYDPQDPTKEFSTLKDLYYLLRKKTPEKYRLASFDSLDFGTRYMLSNYKITYPLLLSGSLWEQWTKFCQLGGLYIYENYSGIVTCKWTLGS